MAFLPRVPFRGLFRGSALAATAVLVAALLPASAAADADPRIGLGAGWLDAQSAASNMRAARSPRQAGRASSTRRTPAISDSSRRISRSAATTRSWATSTGSTSSTSRTRPTRRIVTSVVCPGGQGDMSVHGNLLFMSVEESPGAASTAARTRPSAPGSRACASSTSATWPTRSRSRPCRPAAARTPTRCVDRPGRPRQRLRVRLRHGRRASRGDVGRLQQQPADRREPVAVAHRGHQGSARRARARPRSSASRGCSPTRRPGRSTACRTRRPRRLHPSGTPWGPTPITDACHDITTFPAIGLAAGACEGNGILIDISDPANPVRIDAGVRPELRVLALGHVQQRRHQGDLHRRVGRRHQRPLPRPPTSRSGAPNAIFDIVDRKMEFAQLLQAAGPADACRRTASPTTARSSRCRVATSWSRPGTRAASR